MSAKQEQHILDYTEFHNEQIEWLDDLDNRTRLQEIYERNKWIEDYVKTFPIDLEYTLHK